MLSRQILHMLFYVGLRNCAKFSFSVHSVDEIMFL